MRFSFTPRLTGPDRLDLIERHDERAAEKAAITSKITLERFGSGIGGRDEEAELAGKHQSEK